MKNLVYTLTLNPAIDYVMKTDGLRSDDINRSKEEAFYYGGKGINVSVVLSRLEVENKALGFLAGFTGKELEKMLKADGINCDFNYLKNGNTRINVKIKAQGELDINAAGPFVGEEDMKELLNKLDSLRTGDYLVLAGSVPESLSSSVYERILHRLEGRGINAVVDATGEALLNTLKYRPFLIKPNHHELGDLFKSTAESDDEIKRYANDLRKRGARNVLVSRAEKGAMLIDENGKVHNIGNAKGKLVNSVGCGDSMLAGFIAGYIKEQSYPKALMLGTACGNATAYSNSLATKKEIEDILKEIKKQDRSI